MNQLQMINRMLWGFRFNPLEYNPFAWFDSSDVDTIIMNENSLVSQWNDKSENNYHVTQQNKTLRPQYQGINGIFFNYKYLDINIPNLDLSTITVFIVHKSLYSAGDNTLFDSFDTSYFSFFITNLKGIYAGTLLLHGIAIEFPMTRYAIEAAVFNSSNSKLYFNNQLSNSGNVGSNHLRNGFSIGRNYASVSLQNTLNGYIQEVIIYDSILTAYQIGIVNYYLSEKWGVQL